MAGRVAGIRGREVAELRAGACVRVINVVVANVTPVLVTLATFITYTLGTGGTLSAIQVGLRAVRMRAITKGILITRRPL